MTSCPLGIPLILSHRCKLEWIIIICSVSFLLCTSKVFLCSEELDLSWQVYHSLSSPYFYFQKIVTTLRQLSSS